ncbi:MAG: phosphoribosyltransferase, partial [Nitrosopumilaceae archaeon]
MDDFDLFGNVSKAEKFLDSIKNGKFLFSFVISYTETSEIPGITFAGADKDSIKFTPPADAEYLYYGNCKTIDKIPMTPDGKPTPALLTKVALESSSIPHIVINAGSKIEPQLPFIQTGLSPGKNISVYPALTDSQISQAVDYGRIVGRTLASMTDCLIIGESIPGGTTTALAVLRGLGYKARVSSSIPDNPVILKNQIASMA